MSFTRITNNVIQIRGSMSNFYLLIDSPHWWLIDSGFVGDLHQLNKTISELGLEWCGLRAILMTHGHLDHAYNLSGIQRLSEAPIVAHIGDKENFLGKYPYKGLSKVCGGLELTGRALFGYTPCEPDRYINDGHIIDCLGGLKAIHTPGHTKGHLSYLMTESRLLFSGDLVVNYKWRVTKPFPWLNIDEAALSQSIKKILDQNPTGILANHCDEAIPSTQLDRLQRARL